MAELVKKSGTLKLHTEINDIIARVHREMYVPPVTPKVTQSYPKKQQVPGYR